MILAPTLSLSSGSGAAIVRPTFSRDFAGEKTLNNGTGPAITFTRASGATYFDADGVLQTAANDVPRFDHDPANGASRGLLIEEARTNLLLRSEEIDTASWGKVRVTASSDAGNSPAGTATADAILETVEDGIHEFRQSAVIATTGNHTFSVFLKANGRDFVTLFVRENASSGSTYINVGVNLSDGTIVSGSTIGTASITSVGNGWYRVAVSGSVDSGTRHSVIRLREDASTTSYIGDITKGVLAWGAQLEAGAFPTSYIPTTNAAATRAADLAYVTPISSFYNEAEGTLFVEHAPLYASGDVANNIGLITFGTTSTDFVQFQSLGAAAVRASSVDQAGLATGGASARGVYAKRILTYKTDDFAATGSLLVPTVNTDTSGSVPTGLSELRLARASSRIPAISNHFAKIAYYPKRLTNTLLEQLST